MNNRESNIARGWRYSQQSNLYLKKAALYSLENPLILWSCQPLISKGSLADRDPVLSYGARELWFWHQICRYIEGITWPRGDTNFSCVICMNFISMVLKVSLTSELRSLVRDTFSTILMKFIHITQLEAHLRMHLRRSECRHEKLSGVWTKL